MKRSGELKYAYIAGLLVLSVCALVRPAWGGLVSGCTADTCTWEISVDGSVVMTGSYTSDADTGDISLLEPFTMQGPDFTVSLTEMSGNIDPVLGFGLGATNSSALPKTFAFAFSLPLGGLPVPINTASQLGTTLTAFTAAGGSVFPTLGGGKIVDSQDIAFSPFASVDKGVDIGNGLSVASQTTATNIENASGSIIAGGPYDLMSVVVAFGLTPNTGVGFSGFVEQTPVPVPAAVWLFGTGLIGLIAVARRKA